MGRGEGFVRKWQAGRESGPEEARMLMAICHFTSQRGTRTGSLNAVHGTKVTINCDGERLGAAGLGGGGEGKLHAPASRGITTNLQQVAFTRKS